MDTKLKGFEWFKINLFILSSWAEFGGFKICFSGGAAFSGC